MKMLTVALALGATLAAQQTTPTFEVASIKPNTSITGSVGVSVSPSGRVAYTRFSLRDLIWISYGGLSGADIQGPDQIEGGPAWMNGEHFDIVAKANGDIQPVNGRRSDRLAQMLKSLVDERFHLKAHVETRETTTYALVYARKDAALGPKIHPTTHTCPKEAMCGFRGSRPGHFVGQGVTMAEIASAFANSSVVNRPVRDATGRAGQFDFDVEYTPPPPAPNPEAATTPDADMNARVLSAAEDQLGLKLRSEKGRADFIVIDHVERPTPD